MTKNLKHNTCKRVYNCHIIVLQKTHYLPNSDDQQIEDQ